MNSIPKKLRADMAADPFYHACARQEALHDHECERDPLRPMQPVEWDHTLTCAGRQVQKKFAIVPACWWAHRGPGFVKEINIWIALNRATDEELAELTSAGGRDYFRYREYLNGKYGVYKVVEKSVDSIGINYGFPVESFGVIPAI